MHEWYVGLKSVLYAVLAGKPGRVQSGAIGDLPF